MRIVRSGLSVTVSPSFGERQHDRLARRAALLLGRVEDVVGLVGRGLAEQVVGEVACGRMEIEEGALLGRLVLVAVDDSLRDHEHRAGAAVGALVAELERVLALEHDEAVGVLAVEVPARAAHVARAHVGEDEARGVHEHADRRLGHIDQGLAGARHGGAAYSGANASSRRGRGAAGYSSQ